MSPTRMIGTRARIISKISMFNKEDRSTFPYWFAHWCSYNMTALNLKAWKFKYLFHDIEKPFLKLFLPYKRVQGFHRKHNRHHVEWLENQLRLAETDIFYDKRIVPGLLNKFDYDGAIIDWECSHYTKSQCKLDGCDECRRLLGYEGFKEEYPLIAYYCYNEFSERLLNSVERLGLMHN